MATPFAAGKVNISLREPSRKTRESQGNRPLTLDENVQYTVFRPRVVQPGKWYPLLAFAHLSEQRPETTDEPDPIEEVQRQARQSLGPQASEFQDVTQDSRQAIPRAEELTFIPEVPGIEFNPPRRSFLWLESVHREDFRLRASSALDGRTARGRVSVLLGSILVAEVNLTFRVDSRYQSPAAPFPVEPGGTARPYRKIFASYSHKDLSIVEEFERYAAALGDEYLRDLIHLRAGEVWDARLNELIDAADVFQLFWSRNSMLSKYVEQEWRYALSLNRPSFIRPTYWEDPLPEFPERDLPPQQLRQLHFQRVYTNVSGQSEPESSAPNRREVQPAAAAADGAQALELQTAEEMMPPPAAAGEAKESSGEFELPLDDSGGLEPIEEEGAADSGDKDILETDFDMPALDEESGSEAVALDEGDTDLESSDFDLSMGEEGDGGQVVTPHEEEADGAATVARRSRPVATEENEADDRGELLADDVVDEMEEEDEMPPPSPRRAPATVAAASPSDGRVRNWILFLLILAASAFAIFFLIVLWKFFRE